MTSHHDKPTKASSKSSRDVSDRDLKHFRRLVATRRSALGLSQKELAARMHTSRSAVARAVIHNRGQAAKAALAGLAGLGARGGLGAVAVAALLLLAIVVDQDVVALGLAAATVGALWLSVIVAERGATTRMRAAIVVPLWLSVIGVVLISNDRVPGVSDGGDDGSEAALAAPGTEDQDGAAGSVLGLTAAGDGQSLEATGVPGAAALPLGAQGGPCASLGRAGKKPTLLTAGILPTPWGGLVIRYPKPACGPESRITIAGVSQKGSQSRGVYAGSQGSSLGSQGGSSGSSQGGSSGARNTVGSTVKKPVSGAGNVVNTVGSTVKKPVSGVSDALNGLGQ